MLRCIESNAICQNYITDTKAEFDEHISFAHKTVDEDVIENMLKPKDLEEKKTKVKRSNSPVSDTTRSKQEIEYITRNLKKLRKKMFLFRTHQMCNPKCGLVPEFVTYFRAMKQFFNNPNDLEDDIQEFIEVTFSALTKIYDEGMAAITYLMDWLLEDPSLCMKNKIAELDEHLHTMRMIAQFRVYSSKKNHSDHLQLQAQLSDLYEYHIMKQLPVETKNACEIANAEGCFGTLPEYSVPGPEFWSPFMDPKTLELETYEDEFTRFLEMKWLFNDQYCVCQKRFDHHSILKHISHTVKCRELFSDFEEMITYVLADLYLVATHISLE